MNKTRISLIISLFLTTCLAAQRTPYDKGTMVFYLGAGVYSTVYSSEHSPSYNIGIERGVAKVGPGTVGLGLVGNFQTSSFNLTSGNPNDYLKYDLKNYTFDIRGTYHPDFFPSKIIDIYGGFLMGANIVDKSITPFGNTVSLNTNLGPSSGIHIGLLAGARAYIWPKIGIFTELGYDVSPIKLGVQFKF